MSTPTSVTRFGTVQLLVAPPVKMTMTGKYSEPVQDAEAATRGLLKTLVKEAA